MKNVLDFLTQWNQSDDTYVIYGNSKYSYRQINELVELNKKTLSDTLVNNQNVAVFLKNSPEYVCAYFSNLAANNTNIPISVELKKNEIISELVYCDCNWIICSSQHKGLIEEIAVEIGVGVILIEDTLHFKVSNANQVYKNRENDASITVMLHTSGTTGNPKKVMLSHGNIIANTESNILSLDLNKNDKVLIALPMFFGYCHTAQFLTHTRLGGQLIIYDQSILTAKHFCNLVKDYEITCFTAVPTMLYVLDKYPYLVKCDLKSLRYVCYGGGVPNLNVIKSLSDKLRCVGFVHTYGQTECSPRITALLPVDSKTKFGSVGKPIPYVEVSIIDERSKVLSSGEIGEICVRGKNVTTGYYKRISETNKILFNEWLHTGDLGSFDLEGYLWLKGRKKNVINRGGQKIYPEEVEQLVMTHSAVQQAIVVPERHESFGEVPICKIISKNGQKVEEEELQQLFHNNLALYKHPVRIDQVESFPQTMTHKLKRI